MSRRSWKTLRDSAVARQHGRLSVEKEQEQKTRVGHMLTEQPSFRVEDVIARLDRRDAEDRAGVERRLAAIPKLDLGDDA